MLTISYTTTVTLLDLFECCPKCPKDNFWDSLSRQIFFKTHALLIDGLDKALCGMCKSLIIETLYEVSIVFRKESFMNAKKILNFIQSLTNEKKVIKALTVFHTTPPPPCHNLAAVITSPTLPQGLSL